MRLADPVLVVGAGIGGLTAALALAKTGLEVEIFERAATLEPIGAGLQLSANALRVLDRLAIGPTVAAAGTVARSVVLRAATSGRRLAEVPVTASDGTGYVAIHRGDLQTALLDACAAEPRISLHLGHALVGLEPDAGGATVTVRTAAGASHRRAAPLVVAADGVASACAAAIRLPGPAPSGSVALRWIAPAAASGQLTSGIEAWLGPRCHAVAYPIRSGREINIVLIAPKNAIEGDGPALTLIRNWDPRLRGMIAAARPAGVWPLATTPPTRPMSAFGSVALLGDAAHALLPFAAQGAAMAIEDGYVLARAVAAADSIPAALAAYGRERVPRIERVRARVRFHDLVYHLPRPLSFGRDIALALRSSEALGSDLAWLYDWQPD